LFKGNLVTNRVDVFQGYAVGCQSFGGACSLHSQGSDILRKFGVLSWHCWVSQPGRPLRPALGPTHPPIQWVPEALSLGVKRPGHEADLSPPSSAEVKVCVELYLNSHNRL